MAAAGQWGGFGAVHETSSGCRAEASCWNEDNSCTWSHPAVACRHTVEAAVAAVHVPDSVIDVLTSLRDYLQDKCEPPIYVSDRRFMKAINLLQVAAHADNREEVGPCITGYLPKFAAVHFTRLAPHCQACVSSLLRLQLCTALACLQAQC